VRAQLDNHWQAYLRDHAEWLQTVPERARQRGIVHVDPDTLAQAWGPEFRPTVLLDEPAIEVLLYQSEGFGCREWHLDNYTSFPDDQQDNIINYGVANIFLPSLVRDGQTSPHKPRLVIHHSTCPVLVLHCPPPPPAHSFIIGPAVINTHLPGSRAAQDSVAIEASGRPGTWPSAEAGEHKEAGVFVPSNVLNRDVCLPQDRQEHAIRNKKCWIIQLCAHQRHACDLA